MKRLICGLVIAAVVPLTLSAPSIADARSRGEHDHHQDRWDDRGDHRERGRRTWDREQHNGYYYHQRWHYGPPPSAYFDDPYYRPGYSAWRRGAALPPFYRGYVVTDYRRYRLRPPPRGFVWYRVGDAFLLTGLGDGVIFEIVPY